MQENNEDTQIMLVEIKKDIEYIKAFIKDADKKYANKLAEKLVYGLVGMILIGVASALIAGVVTAAEEIIIR